MPIVAGASDPLPSNVRQRAIAWQAHRSAGMDLVKNTIPTPFSLDRLLPTPSRDDAVTDPSLPHTVKLGRRDFHPLEHRLPRRTPDTFIQDDQAGINIEYSHTPFTHLTSVALS